MKKLLQYILLLAGVSAITLISFACSCNCGRNDEITIPDAIIKKADKFITDRTSKEFFDKYITLDLSKTIVTSAGYNFAYKLKIPEKPFVDALIQFYADSLGEVKPERGVVGLPYCLSNPAECAFEIDEIKAVRIAKEAGLEQGIKEWRKMFVWSDKHQTYSWVILSTSEESNGTNGYRGKGREVVINSTTGEVIENKEWFIR